MDFIEISGVDVTVTRGAWVSRSELVKGGRAGRIFRRGIKFPKRRQPTGIPCLDQNFSSFNAANEMLLGYARKVFLLKTYAEIESGLSRKPDFYREG